MPRTSVEDPLLGFRFVVEIDGMARAGFAECSGLERTTEVTKYREGGDNETPKKSPGLSEHGDLVLKRGQILDEGQNDLYNWSQEIYNVQTKAIAVRDFRRTIDIVQYERGGLEALRWRVHECWINRFKPMSDLNGNASENSIEEITVVNEGFEKVA